MTDSPEFKQENKNENDYGGLLSNFIIRITKKSDVILLRTSDKIEGYIKRVACGLMRPMASHFQWNWRVRK